MTVFASGKPISTAAKSVARSIQQLEQPKDLLVSSDFVKRVSLVPKIRNVVATLDLQNRIDLNGFATSVSKSIFEPEQFPGLIRYNRLYVPSIHWGSQHQGERLDRIQKDRIKELLNCKLEDSPFHPRGEDLPHLILNHANGNIDSDASNRRRHPLGCIYHTVEETCDSRAKQGR